MMANFRAGSVDDSNTHQKGATMLRKWTPGANDELVECNGMINHGDRATIVHVGRRDHYVPAGWGLISTPYGLKVAKPGDWIQVEPDGITMDVWSPQAIGQMAMTLLESLDEEPETPEGVDDFLRRQGYDPEEIATKGREMAREALEKMRKELGL
jgi:hypothetical protein